MSRELRTYTLAVVVEPAEDAWHAYCPTLLGYGAATWGSTREEAREHLREMVAMVVERLAEEHVAILAAPADPAPLPMEQIVVTVCVGCLARVAVFSCRGEEARAGRPPQLAAWASAPILAGQHVTRLQHPGGLAG